MKYYVSLVNILKYASFLDNVNQKSVEDPNLNEINKNHKIAETKGSMNSMDQEIAHQYIGRNPNDIIVFDVIRRLINHEDEYRRDYQLK